MAKDIGFGSSISTSTGALAQVRSISYSGTAATDIDTTTLDSTSFYRTFVPGLIDPGEITAELVWDPVSAGHAKLADYHGAQTVLDGWSIHLTGSSSDPITFSGYIKGIQPDVPLDDLITNTITIKITGIPGFTT